METLPDFSNLCVGVVGDIFLDVYYECSVDRISPEAPVPIIRTTHDKRSVTLGGAGNTAMNLKALGAKTLLFGVAGRDRAGLEIHQLLSKAGINDLIIDCAYMDTIQKVRLRNCFQHIARIDYEKKEKSYYNCKNERQNWSIVRKIEFAIKDLDALILSDYNKGTLEYAMCIDIINICKYNKVPVFVDPKDYNWTKYIGADYIKPNLKEFMSMVNFNGWKQTIAEKNNSIENFARKAIDLYAIDNILITRGKDGMTFVSRNSITSEVVAEKKEIFDVCGAGDTVMATFALCILAELADHYALWIAHKAAEVVIEKAGTQTVTREEIVEALKLEECKEAS